ncbi:hypothetical protein [Roseospirillum parvum]|uniref:4Fe-4S ferredoxin-type domain-containing protein n=1 Tax=Roseospirillum parvum TaxID=83401 RepID=A0A1G7WWQ3_9PROT|nr:hypothetical protein [Roseospirillum parvum]SDG76319.1 hypothetical protein SAMN05421742_102345 [Roseospirillum parvum]
MKFFSDRTRPAHLGPFPLERLARQEHLPAVPEERRPRTLTLPDTILGREIAAQMALLDPFRDSLINRTQADIPDDPEYNTRVLKAAAYDLDAAMVGVCELPRDAVSDDRLVPPPHGHALVIVVEHAHPPGRDSRAEGWAEGATPGAAALMAMEIANALAAYIRTLGHDARAHAPGHSEVDLERLAVEAGVAQWRNGQAMSPFLLDNCEFAVVSSALPLVADDPLPDNVYIPMVSWSVGRGGSTPALERISERFRRSYHGRYPMHKIRRVRRPSAGFDDDNPPPRTPQPTLPFARDPDDPTLNRRDRRALRHPMTAAVRPMIEALAPLHDGPKAEEMVESLVQIGDPTANVRAIKSLAYMLGADMVGACPIPEFAWHTQRADGRPINPDHSHAVVILIDQGQANMMGSTGHDWVNGDPCPRTALRGSRIATLLAATLRGLGHDARAHGPADGELHHAPLILEAGLAEMSPVADRLINPYLGTRFRSVVVSTNLPLRGDMPLWFGLQKVCSKCRQCLRACPVGRIRLGFGGDSLGPSPDGAGPGRCELPTDPESGDITGQGVACDDCMRTCPYNNDGTWLKRALLDASIKSDIPRRTICLLDEFLIEDKMTPSKRWWHPLEMIDGVARWQEDQVITPPAAEEPEPTEST